MGKWIEKDYEKNIKDWYQKVRAEREDTLYLVLKEKNDFFALENFFLICQKHPERELKLEIRCPTGKDVVARIKTYIYFSRKLAASVKINGHSPYMDLVNFYKILPMISVNQNNYAFLSAKISDIENHIHAEFGNSLLLMIESKNIPLSFEQRILLRFCLTGLYGEIYGIKKFGELRRDYFEKSEFKNMIKNIPFLALLIFTVYDRERHVDLALKCKDEKRKKYNLKKVILNKEDLVPILPRHEDVEADIFIAWDLSDGILQLLENVVEHAGNTGKIRRDGKGFLSIRIHENLNGNKYLDKEYDQYLKGYENLYKDEYRFKASSSLVDRTEKQYFSDCHVALKEQINGGRFVDKDILDNYEEIRSKIDQRRSVRAANRYYLEIRISDFSGKNMCEVFRENLKKQKYSNYDEFDGITIRSFFDPAYREKESFEKYYHANNIINHYGLQIFTSVLLNNDGFFRVRSHSDDGSMNSREATYDTAEKSREFDLKECMPGTRYQILLPFRRQDVQASNSMVNTNILYHTESLEEWNKIDRTNENINKFYLLLSNYNPEDTTKENIIIELYQCLTQICSTKKDIIEFDMENIPFNKIEIFSKAIILYIALENEQRNLAMTNCSTKDFVSIVRIFAVCYDKNGMNNWMDNSQVYLCGRDTRQEFLLSGKDIRTLLTRVQKLAFSRKIHPMCIQILKQILEKKGGRDGLYTYNQSEGTSTIFKYTPFDLVLKKRDTTIFENNVSIVLKNNIQNIESGCRIMPTHMRLGSKIHIDKFYEAELLFYNNYYTGRFACLLAQRLQENINREGLQINKLSICLIGYETYSEMLLCELKSILKNVYNIPCEYVIYEIKKDGSVNLRYEEYTHTHQRMKAFIIVPINSTLTTFNKVKAEVSKNLQELEIIGFMGVIQVRDNAEKNYPGNTTEIESDYWDEIDTKNKYIISKKLLGENQRAEYLVLVECRWSNPLTCTQCFPEDCLFEMPLIETDKTSVVPTQLIGLQEKGNREENHWLEWKAGPGIPESLEEYFYHGHIVRNDNHFCYYIRTANYYQRYRKDICDWLREIKDSIIKNASHDETVVFNVIVAPMHFSNTAFTEAVNDVVFQGASYVLRIESEKEFRDNIQTKYSDLTALYNNFLRTGNNAVINFYYVDDTIITGKSFYRIRHLVKSLFNPVSGASVNVNIFKAIIVLLNRSSVYSISNYVEKVEDYYAYLNLNISNLRSFEDACFLCKKETDNLKLAEYSSTNAINQYWVEKKKKYKLKPLEIVKKETIEKRKSRKGSLTLDRLFRRMLATHYMNNKMGDLGVKRNNTYDIYSTLIKEINERKFVNTNNKLEIMTAYIYAMAYPFVVYRKSCREAVFHMILILFEMFLIKDTTESLRQRTEQALKREEISEKTAEEFILLVEESKALIHILNKIRVGEKEEFLKFLIKVSVELKSNYIIRADRIEIILKYYWYLCKNKRDKINNFVIYFTAMVKKLLFLSSDSSKSAKFENILVAGLKKWYQKKNGSAYEKYLRNIYISLYMENTGGIFDAVQDLNKNGIHLEEYYLENYVKIFKINGIESSEEQRKISEYYKDVFEYLQSINFNSGSKKIELPMSGEAHKYIEYYNLLAKKIGALTEAVDVQFLIRHKESVLKIDEENKVVFDCDTYRYEVFSCNHPENYVISVLDKDSSRMKKLIDNLMMDTFSFDEEYAVIMYNQPILNTEESELEHSYFQPVYMLLKYNQISLGELEKIRRVFVFRNMMMEQFEKDFGNNVMQNWLEQVEIIKHMEKARAFVHANDSDQENTNNIWNICKGFFYGRPSDIEKHYHSLLNKGKKDTEKIKDGCILELMTDIRIGRINLLLLSNSKFEVDSYSDKHPFRIAKQYLEILKKAIYWNENVNVYNKTGQLVHGQIIEEEIYDAFLAPNRNGKYNRVNEYLSYLIAETIHSAVLYSKKNKDKVEITIYKENEYLYICNPISSPVKMQRKRVESGLARRGNGISLAVVCEYFLKQYDNRYVKINISGNTFKIGLPIFEK